MVTTNLPRQQSCGCLKTEQLVARSTTHGQSASREFQVWAGMLDRCYREKRKDFARYGGRGVTVCDRWRYSFANFFADMGARPTDNHSIDRIDPEGHYEPSNCRWTTAHHQRVNQRRSVILEFQGIRGSLKDLARHFGLSYSAVHQRMTLMNWTLERALTEPVQPRKHRI